MGLFVVQIVKAEKFEEKDIELLKRFIEDPEVEEEEPKLICMAKLAHKLYHIGYNDLSDIRVWVDHTIRTALSLARHYYTCYLIKPGEGASRIEIIRYQACINSFKARAYLEWNRKKAETYELIRYDFNIQLAIGAWKCGVIPSPIVEGKVEEENDKNPDVVKVRALLGRNFV